MSSASVAILSLSVPSEAIVRAPVEEISMAAADMNFGDVTVTEPVSATAPTPWAAKSVRLAGVMSVDAGVSPVFAAVQRELPLSQ